MTDPALVKELLDILDELDALDRAVHRLIALILTHMNAHPPATSQPPTQKGVTQ